MELHVFNISTQIYRRGSNGFIIEKTILFGSRGGPTFSSGGVQILISIEPHITCDFPGAGPDPLSPYGSACQKHRGSNTDRNRSLNMWTD